MPMNAAIFGTPLIMIDPPTPTSASERPVDVRQVERVNLPAVQAEPHLGLKRLLADAVLRVP